MMITRRELMSLQQENRNLRSCMIQSKKTITEAIFVIKDLSAKNKKLAELEKENQKKEDLQAKNQNLQTKLNQANDQIDNLIKVKALEHEKMRKYRDTITKYRDRLKRKRDQCQFRNKCNKKQNI